MDSNLGYRSPATVHKAAKDKINWNRSSNLNDVQNVPKCNSGGLGRQGPKRPRGTGQGLSYMQAIKTNT